MVRHQVYERVSLLAKEITFQRIFRKEVISVASSPAWIVSENWFVVRESQGNVIAVSSGNPENRPC